MTQQRTQGHRIRAWKLYCMQCLAWQAPKGEKLGLVRCMIKVFFFFWNSWSWDREDLLRQTKESPLLIHLLERISQSYPLENTIYVYFVILSQMSCMWMSANWFFLISQIKGIFRQESVSAIILCMLCTYVFP